jgi:predicted DNA-binding transcriptional regulator AlpA
MGNRRKDQTKISYNGEEHTLCGWSKILGIPYNRLRSRVFHLKWPVEKAFTEGKQGKTLEKISYNGEEHSLGEWAKILGIPYVKLYERIVKYKWSAERAFNMENARTPDIFSYNGEERSLYEWAKVLGISYDMLTYRVIDKKWPLEKAVTEQKVVYPKHNIDKPMLYYQWRRLKRLSLMNPDLPAGGWEEWSTFEKFEEWAIKTGRTDNDMYCCKKDADKPHKPSNMKWIKRQEWFMDRPTNEVGWGQKERIFEHNGKIHTLREWEEITGIPKKAIYNRIHVHKWDIGRALSEPLSAIYRKRSLKLEYNGEEHTLKEWAKITGISRDTIYNRLYHFKWDVERALTEPSQYDKNKK